MLLLLALTSVVDEIVGMNRQSEREFHSTEQIIPVSLALRFILALLKSDRR